MDTLAHVGAGIVPARTKRATTRVAPTRHRTKKSKSGKKWYNGKI